MYLFFSISFLILIVFFFINFYRRKKIIKKVSSMNTEEKYGLLNQLISPFGYAYIPSQDIFTSRIDAWQRDFAYSSIYDKAALSFNMVFDCLPVYFDYHGRTWRIEFWKGQYGINTGGEIGIYYANRILADDELNSSIFYPVANEDMLKLSFCLSKNGGSMANICSKHWWLTAFDMGCFSNPRELSMKIYITFKSAEMARSFVLGLKNTEYNISNISLCCNNVSFVFSKSPSVQGIFRRLHIRFVQCINHFWCSIYLLTTKPFTKSVDRILYLYYYLPFAFRKMLRLRRQCKK